MAETSIEWTDYTFNPWWGCQRISPGCERCYAEAWAKRTGHRVWGPMATRRFFGDLHWALPLTWNRKALAEGVRRRVFCASMADVFEVVPATRDPDLALRMDLARQRLWALIQRTPGLDWLLLTKRPENVDALVPLEWLDAWPRNVWLGVTVEDQLRARERLSVLVRLRTSIDIPIAFISYEPALELVDFEPWLWLIDWIIVGGESGGGARPFDLPWARAVVKATRGRHAAVFVKQLGSDPIDGLAGCEVTLRHRKGADPTEWPEELRVREFPRREETAA
jgi:protein gp37